MAEENDSRRVNYTAFDMNDEMNALCFLIRSKILTTVNTAIPVRVDKVYKTYYSESGRPLETKGATYVSATPLICQTDTDGNALEQTSIPRLLWIRLQHGNCAFICDPEVGDVGLAVFCQSDVSGLTGGTTPSKPNSFRAFDMSDGVYIGGLWGKTPTNFVKIESGAITVTSTNTVTVNCTTATVNATSKVTLNTPETTMTGHCTIQGGLNVSGGNGAHVTGDMVTTGDVTANGISLDNHVHTGVQTGGSRTGGPV